MKKIIRPLAAAFSAAAMLSAAEGDYLELYLKQVTDVDFTQSTDIYYGEGPQSNQYGTQYKDLDLTHAQFDYGTITNCIFKGKDLSDAKFESAKVYDSNFDFANMQNTNLRQSFFIGVSFIGADLRGALFKYPTVPGFVENGRFTTKNTIWDDGRIVTEGVDGVAMSYPEDYLYVRRYEGDLEAAILVPATLGGHSTLFVEEGGALRFLPSSPESAEYEHSGFDSASVIVEYGQNIPIAYNLRMMIQGESTLTVIVPFDFSPTEGTRFIAMGAGPGGWLSGDFSGVSVKYEDGRDYYGSWTSEQTGMDYVFVFAAYGSGQDAVSPAVISGISVSEGTVALAATSKNTKGYYTVYSASSLTAESYEWYSNIETSGALDSNGGFTTTFAQKGGARFYRVALAANSRSSDQIHSANVAGYYTLNLPARTLQYVANQFMQTDQQIASLFDRLPNRSTVVAVDSGGNSVSAVKNPVGAGWNANGSITVGIGREVQVTSPSDTSIIICGVLNDGTYSKAVSARTEMLSCSILPLAGAPEDFGLELKRGITVRQLDASGNLTSKSTAPVGAAWAGGVAPVIKIGEAFILSHPEEASWEQTLRIYSDTPEIDIFN